MRLRISFLSISFFLCSIFLRGQIYDAYAATYLQHLVQQGWQIQHQSIAYDSLTLYISARSPKQNVYRIYILELQGKTWGKHTSTNFLLHNTKTQD